VYISVYSITPSPYAHHVPFWLVDVRVRESWVSFAFGERRVEGVEGKCLRVLLGGFGGTLLQDRAACLGGASEG